MPMEPSTQLDILGKIFREASQVHKHRLGHVLRQMRVAASQPNRSGIDQAEVARDQFPKGRFRTAANVIGEKCLAVRHRLPL